MSDSAIHNGLNGVNRRTFLRGSTTLASASTLAWLIGGAAAQETFPNRAVSAIVAASAGGSFDLLLRMVQPAWEERLGQPIRAIFSPGGGGQVATQRLLSQPPDGYNVAVSAITNIAVAQFYSASKDATLDNLSFTGTLLVEPLALLVPKESRFADLQSFLAEARTGDTPVRLGVGGSRTFYHLVSAIFKREADAQNLSLIIYTGGGGASRNALIAGELDGVITGLYSASGIFDQLRGLVVFDKASPIPDLMPMPGIESLDFTLPETLHPTGIVVPAALKVEHPERYDFLIQTFQDAMADSRTIDAAEKLGFPEAGMQSWTPERLEGYKKNLTDMLETYGPLL